MVALMGETGAGKSTICDLVLGLYYNYRGRILFNGTELRQLDLKSLRPSMGYVSQEPLLIRGSIRDNLLYGCHEVKGEDEILRALQQSQAWEFVRRLPHRLDSKLGERGVNLSGGERQRLCLARELLRRPELLVMDEATAALDLETEALILADLRNLKEHMIILLVSHRLSVGKFVDRQITLEQGRLIQSRLPA
jgi:ATP-binding cassette subfamily C protein